MEEQTPKRAGPGKQRRLSIDISEELYQRVWAVIPHGMGKAIFVHILEDFITLVEHLTERDKSHQMKQVLLGTLMNGNLTLEDILRAKEKIEKEGEM